MNPEKQRIAIAKACNLERIEPFRRATRKGDFAADGVRIMYCESHMGGAGEWVDLPDYLNDLNACHQMEKVLTKEQAQSYSQFLGIAMKMPDVGYFTGQPNFSIAEWERLIMATAPQRCEAFLRTLNLWEEEA